MADEAPKEAPVKTEPAAESAAPAAANSKPAAGVKAEPSATNGLAAKNGKKASDDMDESSDSSSDSSDDDDDVPIQKKIQSDKAKAAPKPKPKPVAKKPPVKRKAPPKKKARVADSDSESSSDTSSSSESSDSDSDDEDDAPLASKKRKREPRESKKAKSGSMSHNDVSKYEMRTRNVQLTAKNGANKWWKRKTDKSIRWTTLEHNGPVFPPEHTCHGIPLTYDKKPVKLSASAEEVATFYASMLETDFMKKQVFNDNFFRDWRKTMTDEERKLITDLKKCDFKAIHAYIMKEREEKKESNKLPENKKRIKEEKEALMSIHGHALIDGYLEAVGNFRVEPPSLFRGRGEHPKTGTLKLRVKPEQVVINMGKGMTIPAPPEGHHWKGVVHNNKVTWLAYWQDNVNGDYKYVYLSANSRFKGESDVGKYRKAQELVKHISKIRDNYKSNMTHAEEAQRQMGVAMYALDVLALRVGNEKDLDERADTVGLCSLRVEHVTFPEENKIHLNFLGKDSMVYDNTIDVPAKVWKNIKEFTKKKKPKDELFDKLDPTKLNSYLKEIMPGLSAKVFRTYNASITLEEMLAKPDEDGEEITCDTPDNEKLLFYNRANREVAILCNHQRSIPKAFDGQMEKLGDKLKELEDYLADLKKHMKTLKAGKGVKTKTKTDKPLPDSVEKCKNKIKKQEEMIHNKQTQITLKSDTKTVALGTSKINYMDPRVSIAWCKRVDMPLEKIFNKSLVSKFPWAMEVKSSWSFKKDRD